MDYYSKFIEVDELKDLQSSTVINTLKSQFSRHGIPQKLRSDCGSQYTSQDFKRFCHTSSPHYQQCNGEAEKAVQTVKRMWSKAQDKHLALLDYRTTPLEGLNLSPARLLMGRRPRNKLPSASALLIPSAHDTKEVKRHFAAEKMKQKLYYDRRTTHEHSPLNPGDHVRMAPLPGKKNWLPATVVRHHELPRSYIVQSGDNKFRRNLSHLRLSTEEANASSPLTEDFPEDISSTPLPDTVCVSPQQHASTPRITVPTVVVPQSATPKPSSVVNNRSQGTYKTSSGRTVKPPDRLDL